MKHENIQKLKHAARQKLRTFDSIRGREVKSGLFWDVVVVSAADESQREAYELQIREKVSRHELPLVQYLVFSDPPGAKIGMTAEQRYHNWNLPKYLPCVLGNGGSTLYCLRHLSELLGKTFSSMKVLLIHAGGSSQRLPSASALGKLFMAVPLGEPLYQMLELKLAMYVDFPAQMKPGVLVTCADDIELYSVPKGTSVVFDKPGFTALAHPSPLTIGTTHGVFVLESSGNSSDLEMENKSCLRFLHKPSVEKMKEAGAVCKRQSRSSLLSEAEFVYTDSTYYMDLETAQRLVYLLTQIEPLECEIDAYGDFLQALGPDATVDYTRNTANVMKEEKTLVDLRQKIFYHLKGTPLNVILLNTSKFYHIGTTIEYLFHLTEDEALRSELGLLSSAFSVQNSQVDCCIMHSILHPSCSVGPGTVVEYCRLGAGVSVGKGSILSGCWVNSDLGIPDGVFMHNLCVNQKDKLGFVTVVFGIQDNVKLSVGSSESMEALSLCGVTLKNCLTSWGLDQEALRFSSDMSCCSLWNACLFPVCNDQQSSFFTSLKMLQAVKTGSEFSIPKDLKLLSMQESLACKNLEEMLAFRKEIYDDIKRHCNI
ncbi:LOW QUALITY PROTEIN: fucose-1-phosphate guanylyltransferase [Neosynchiropus ocellatus]